MDDRTMETAGDAAAEPMATSARLTALAEAAPADRVTLGWIMDQLHERAFGFFLLILALPCCIPFLYGVPQVVALPMLVICAQLVAGRRSLWLPERLRERTVAKTALADLARRARPWLERFERFSRPRLGFLTRPPVDRLVGLALLVCSASILVPLPSTNTAPGIGVAVASLGFLERDGVLVSLGALFGLLWVAALVVVGVGLAAYLLG